MGCFKSLPIIKKISCLHLTKLFTILAVYKYVDLMNQKFEVDLLEVDKKEIDKAERIRQMYFKNRGL